MSPRFVVGFRVPFARATALLVGLLVFVLGAADARAGVSFSEQAAINGAAAQDFLGYSVAVDGNTALIGSFNDNGAKGAAFVYTRSGATWTLQQEIVAPDGANNDQFGYTVALSGSTAMIAAVNKSGGLGAVYVFIRSGTFWAENALITGSVSGTCFGCALALSGTTALIGAPSNDGVTGTAYAYVNSGPGWHQQAALTGQQSGEAFGASVGLSPDGSTAIVGAYGANLQAGRAYIFTASGGTWSAPVVLSASDGAAGDRFGYSVAAGNGSVIVGAYLNAGHGSAYVFSQVGATWPLRSKLVAADAFAGDTFGISVAISGSVAVVGAYEKQGIVGPGAAYVFTNFASGWLQEAELLASSSGQYFGYSVAASGTTVAVGAFGQGADAGAAYLFAAPGLPVPAMPGSSSLLMLLAALAAVGAWASLRRPGARA